MGRPGRCSRSLNGRPKQRLRCLAPSRRKRCAARELDMADVMTTRAGVPAIEAKGVRIPLLGLGTWELRGRVCARVVEQALRLGYRHIDTAEMYDNEREVGEGLRGSGVKRDEVFMTTKSGRRISLRANSIARCTSVWRGCA